MRKRSFRKKQARELCIQKEFQATFENLGLTLYPSPARTQIRVLMEIPWRFRFIIAVILVRPTQSSHLGMGEIFLFHTVDDFGIKLRAELSIKEISHFLLSQILLYKESGMEK